MAEKKAPRYFHGTSADLQPGARLVPGARLNKQTWPDKENHSVFMTRTAAGAKQWAGNAAKNHGAELAHVYEVEPAHDPVKRKTPWEGDEYLASEATVVRRVSSHVVLNPGREEGVFGDVPAKLAPVPKVVRQHVEQAKGQLGLFGAKAVGPATANDKRVRAAENERNEPRMEPPAGPPPGNRMSHVEEWMEYDQKNAIHRRYMGLPPTPDVAALERLFPKRGRR